MKLFRLAALITCLAALALSSCDQPSQQNQKKAAPPAPKTSLALVSGSENAALEPLLQQFARQQNIDLSVTYMGSVDISLELAKGAASQFDAVWPASSLWLSLGDKQGVVKNAKSIMRSPVVFAVRKSIAEKLGWDQKDVTVMDILEAVEQEHLRFAMTSATQSNSGTSAFIAFLTAFAGGPEVLTSEHLNDPAARDKIKRFLRSVNRSSGSSGWLMDMLRKDYLYYDGMVNYESMVIQFNRHLPPGQEPLYAVYPVDGISIADSPFGFIAKGDPAKEAAFSKLQEYLLSPNMQERIQGLGCRTGQIGMEADKAKNAVFNSDWGINVSRILTPIRLPAAPVVAEALNLYQTAFRKPSLTAYVLDYSGSMGGNGVEQLRKAMRTLLDQRIAKEYMLQASPDDLTVVVPFNSGVIDVFQAQGNEPQALGDLLAKIEALEPGGGTNMYVAAAEAMKRIKAQAESGKYHASVIVMSDGKSEGSLDQFKAMLQGTGLGKDIPVFTILFGEAQPKQMKGFAEAMSGRMFDGRVDVVKAFREAKGYN
ncbi:Ca-activated chloride channel family protein [Candidatus Electronema halotolerans]